LGFPLACLRRIFSWLIFIGEGWSKMEKKFSVFWSIVLIFGMIWFGQEMGWISYSFDFPWIPAILILFALGALTKRLG